MPLSRRLLVPALAALILVGAVLAVRAPISRSAAQAGTPPIAFLPLIARDGPSATPSVTATSTATATPTRTPTTIPTSSATPSTTATRVPACNSVYPIGILASLINDNGFVPPTDPAEMPYYGIYSDGTYTNKTQRRLILHTVAGDFRFLEWQYASTITTFSAALTGTGTLYQGFDEVVPWPDPNTPAPAGYPLYPHQLTTGDWVSGQAGSVDSAGVRAALNDHIIHRTVMALPIYDNIAGSGVNTSMHFARLGTFLLRGYATGGAEPYLDLVYLGSGAQFNCDSSATATPVESTTVTPHFATVTATLSATMTPSPTATVTPTSTPQALTLTIVNFHFDAYINSTTPRRFSIKTFVIRDGAPFDGALVSGTITRGASSFPVTLASIGNGYYKACDVGSVTGTGSTPSVTLTATDGAGNSASASSSAASTIKFLDCP
jgi:hypothetical protein